MDTTPAAAPPRLDAATYYHNPDGSVTDANGVVVIPAPPPDDAPQLPLSAQPATPAVDVQADHLEE
ncbi:hypothetical protein [Nitrospirillum sp. BR 11163]|uniref:hypothetical protein n=1 Tax=Nitrospirillum sp. BR 11163 TaxID=3104323 RepID=UPI002AFF12FD|nr:hypothetical protein [Nitrospirillum sp. BR 11163]MEA1674098.1 hypothetical protein [Nitrospirillum sp. BR 11163]